MKSMNKDEVIKLAELSRLEVTDDEANAYLHDFEGILGYIDTIAEISVEEKDHYQTNLTANTMRSDDEAYVAGEFTADILANAPAAEDGYFKVKKVL